MLLLSGRTQPFGWTDKEVEMRTAIKTGLVRGVILALYALVGYLFAYVAMGGSL